MEPINMVFFKQRQTEENLSDTDFNFNTLNYVCYLSLALNSFKGLCQLLNMGSSLEKIHPLQQSSKPAVKP